MHPQPRNYTDVEPLTDKTRERLILPCVGFDYAQPTAPANPWIERSRNPLSDDLSGNQR
jgi:hypothetical protein